MRCLTLADRLRKKGANIYFISRLHEGHIISEIEARAYKVYKLPTLNEEIEHLNDHSDWLGVNWLTDALETINCIKQESGTDLMIVDHYAIQSEWENMIRPYVNKIMVIDDLADRIHECDYLLDQNFYTDMQNRYQNLVPSHCELFLGPSYALLRDEFFLEAEGIRTRTGEIKRIFIFFGGSDYHNVTERAIQALLNLNFPHSIDVILGKNNRYYNQLIQRYANVENIFFYTNVSNMAQLMNLADLCIGAGGITTWERCLLGLPTILVSVASNQEQIAIDLARQGAVIYLGSHETVTAHDIFNAVKTLQDNPQKLKQISGFARDIVNMGSKGLEYLVDVLLKA